MADLNRLILTGADYRVALNVPSINVFMIQTANMISWSEAAEGELIYRVGDEYPIGNKQNAFSFKGKFALQAGEMAQILAACGLVLAITLPGASLSITTVDGTLSYTYIGICINTSGVDVKAKDKESIQNLDFTALNVTN